MYQLPRQRNRAGKDVQQAGVIKDVLTREGNVLRWWKELFEELMNVENERSTVNQEVQIIGKEKRG